MDGTAGQRHIRCGSGIDDLGGLSFVALVQRMAKVIMTLCIQRYFLFFKL